MKSYEEFKVGMDKWVKDVNDEMEIFASTYEDEAMMMRFWAQIHAA